MKAIRRAVLSLALLLGFIIATSGCVATYHHSTPEKLGKTLVKILKNQDQPGLGMIIPNEQDLESFLATADMPADELAAFKEEMKMIIGEFMKTATISFERSSDAASRDGVVLSKAKLGDVRTETWQGPDNELANIEMDLTYAEKKYILKIKDAGKVASGWVLGGDGFELVPAGQ
jgi:hypothetical protein